MLNLPNRRKTILLPLSRGWVEPWPVARKATSTVARLSRPYFDTFCDGDCSGCICSSTEQTFYDTGIVFLP